MKRGRTIQLKEFAVPSIFDRNDKLDQPAEPNSLHKHEAQNKMEKMQREIDEKNHQIQNMSHELKTFQGNTLAQFAVKSPQNAQVFFCRFSF